MKRILIIAVALLISQGALRAQNGTSIAEKDVNVNYVKDFQRQNADASNVCWWKLDSLTFKATYLDAEKSRQAMVFSNKGTETHYFIDKQYYPASIRDTVKHLYPQYSIADVWVRKVRSRMTYQALICKRSGFLWWKKVVDYKTLNFETDGKYIDAQ